VTDRDPSDADDIAWLEAREHGASALPPLDPARARAYSELQALIATLPDEAPPPGWEADVKAALAADRVATAAPRRWRAGAAAAATLTAIGLLWLAPWRRPVAPPEHDAPVTRVVHGQVARHGDAGGDAAIGDVLQVEVVRCPGQAVCTQAAGRLAAELPLIAPGRYRALYMTRTPADSQAPALPVTGTLDGDLAACGCAASVAVPIVVR
jgi:hypothetical protein